MFDLGRFRFLSMRALAVLRAASLVAVALPGAALAKSTKRSGSRRLDA